MENLVFSEPGIYRRDPGQKLSGGIILQPNLEKSVKKITVQIMAQVFRIAKTC